SLEEAMAMARDAKEKGEPLSIGLLGNAAEILPDMIQRGFIPDIVTDQTSAHDPLNGYLPRGMTLEAAAAMRKENPEKLVSLAKKSMAVHVQAMLKMQQRGAVAFDYGNNIRQVAKDEGVENAFDFPGFVPAYIRPQ